MISDKSTLIDNQQSELLGFVNSRVIPWERVVELADVVAGNASGRTKDQQVVYYKNNTGMGIQFAAAGKIVLEAAKRKQLGTEIQDDLFGRAR